MNENTERRNNKNNMIKNTKIKIKLITIYKTGNYEIQYKYNTSWKNIYIKNTIILKKER